MNYLTDEEYFKRVNKICLTELIFNYLLTIIKFVGGFIGNSNALISDGIDSLGDSFTSTSFLISNKVSSKKADKDHQFGHAKIESLVCLIFSLVLIFISLILIYNNSITLINKSYLDESIDNISISLIMVIVAIAIKLFLFILTFINYKVTKSPSLKARAIDHLTDSVGTLISLISIILIFSISNQDIKIVDPIASLFINVLVIVGSIRVTYENASLLLDKSMPIKEQDEIKKLILSVGGVLHIDNFRNRIVTNRIFIEVEISCDDKLTLKEAHDISEKIRVDVLNQFKDVKHILVHVNPLEHLDESDL